MNRALCSRLGSVSHRPSSVQRRFPHSRSHRRSGRKQTHKFIENRRKAPLRTSRLVDFKLTWTRPHVKRERRFFLSVCTREMVPERKK